MNSKHRQTKDRAAVPDAVCDEFFMRKAMAEAKKAANVDEVPIGAVAVHLGKVIARAHNVREATSDPFGHAEMLLLKKYLIECKLGRK